MKKFILTKLNGIDEKEYTAYKLQCEETIEALNKEINELKINLDRQRRKISALENDLLMYRDPDNWYDKHKKKLSMIASITLNKKEK